LNEAQKQRGGSMNHKRKKNIVVPEKANHRQTKSQERRKKTDCAGGREKWNGGGESLIGLLLPIQSGRKPRAR